MPTLSYAILPDRGLITVGGADRRDFLQGLVSNDVTRASAECAIWAAFLTPQGKYLHDFFMVEIGEALHLDCEGGDRLMDFGKRLSKYKLRSLIDLGVAPDMAVVALWGEGAATALGLAQEAGVGRAMDAGVVYMDPRLTAAGARAILPTARVAEILEPLGFAAATPEDYDHVRVSLGLPDGTKDMVVEKTILLEANFDALNGVDWEKGCYMGQELTARTKYRGLVKKRLMPVTIEGTAPPAGTPLMLDGKEAGEMRSSRAGLGIALIRLDRIEGGGLELEAEGATVTLCDTVWPSVEQAG
ncbi:MAG: folate-binding protein YgfZ [Proteobacteria bacterium]|nr:folate-binding protein YgfZ [Pseudomonadota bacterium]